jgi:AcrR family transcriptional regulator
MEEEPAAGTRARKRDEATARMLDAAIAVMVSGGELTHDRVAADAGVGRRTVYRYFPDRDALMQAIWARITERAGPQVGFPETEEALLASIPHIHRGFDRIAEVSTLLRSTPQGRTVRLSRREERRAMYAAATADAVADLAEPDRTIATAMLQMLHTTPWLELRDQWGLDGDAIARGIGWTIRTLLADLRARGSAPLDQRPPPTTG